MTPQYLYATKGIREVEQQAIEQSGLSEWVLMQRAAQAAFQVFQQHFPDCKSLAVFCGGGNNAGDGFLMAALAQASGIATQIFITKEVDKLGDTAKKAAHTAMDAGIVLAPLAAYVHSEAEVYVDALLGIGLNGPVHDKMAEVIAWMNAQPQPVFSIDIPSGLHADTGKVLGVAVRAKKTITFIGNKIGLFTADGPDYAGEIILDTIGLSDILRSVQPSVKLIDDVTISTELPPRLKNCHKGHFGHVLLVGGGRGMPGAIMLAAKAALRSGAGLATIATLPEHIAGASSFIPEAMCYGVRNGHDLRPLLARASVVVFGPGTGEDAWARKLYRVIRAWDGLKVIDASALRMLAKKPFADEQRVITPHPGEAGGLLSTNSQMIQADRLAAVKQLHQLFGGTVVLKGCGSLVASSHRLPYLCAAGNPGMATGGMGDVLSGVIAGFMAQGLSPFNAASLAVLVHARAADMAALKMGTRGFLASDLIAHLTDVVNAHRLQECG